MKFSIVSVVVLVFVFGHASRARADFVIEHEGVIRLEAYGDYSDRESYRQWAERLTEALQTTLLRARENYPGVLPSGVLSIELPRIEVVRGVERYRSSLWITLPSGRRLEFTHRQLSEHLAQPIQWQHVREFIYEVLNNQTSFDDEAAMQRHLSLVRRRVRMVRDRAETPARKAVIDDRSAPLVDPEGMWSREWYPWDSWYQRSLGRWMSRMFLMARRVQTQVNEACASLGIEAPPAPGTLHEDDFFMARNPETRQILRRVGPAIFATAFERLYDAAHDRRGRVVLDLRVTPQIHSTEEQRGLLLIEGEVALEAGETRLTRSLRAEATFSGPNGDMLTTRGWIDALITELSARSRDLLGELGLPVPTEDPRDSIPPPAPENATRAARVRGAPGSTPTPDDTPRTGETVDDNWNEPARAHCTELLTKP